MKKGKTETRDNESLAEKRVLPWHALPIDRLLSGWKTGENGLDDAEVSLRRTVFGKNELPRKKAPSAFSIFLHQFMSPLIYILLIAGTVSVIIGEATDAIFIFIVVVSNAVIGTFQEYKSEKSAERLQLYLKSRATVRRAGVERTIDAEEIVPGDLVLLDSGDRVPADIRLIAARNLTADESLLTGESTAVTKNSETLSPEEATTGDRLNMAFAGTSVMSGRGEGIVVRTGLDTELGTISKGVTDTASSKPPLVQRMDRFVTYLSVITLGAVAILFFVSLSRGTPLVEVFFIAVALAVSAIPEGLPVAITIALSIRVNRMAKRNVIVRRLTAVEGLGSCTCIASDKTGTLTVNKQTVRMVSLPGDERFRRFTVSGEGYNGTGEISPDTDAGMLETTRDRLASLVIAGILCNEARLEKEGGGWKTEGLPEDIALLALGYKAGLQPEQVRGGITATGSIPYESERKFAADFYTTEGGVRMVAVKGAVEVVMRRCARVLAESGETDVREELLLSEAEDLASHGFRVMALARGAGTAPADPGTAGVEALPPLTLLGLVGFIDPIRPEARGAIAECRDAGVRVAMVTGDHPATALAIARELGIAKSEEDVVTGGELTRAGKAGQVALAEMTLRATVFARVTPLQKVTIVEGLIAAGEFVAVTGDGVNDAPALRRANIGVAMGSGTDVAKDTGSIIVTDDNFASIVAGVEEGRYAYQNIRKLVYLLIATGAAELLLFIMALAFGLPLPLTAVQLLWLNLVTNGIQDVALAFEAGEPGVMAQPPRDPRESIMNRLMIGEVAFMGGTMALVVFAAWWWLLENGMALTEARNLVLLLMVLFENYHTLNCRSETRSAFGIPLGNNRFLVFGILGALALHIASMYVPFMEAVLETMPVTWTQFLACAVAASSIMIASELFKYAQRRKSPGSAAHPADPPID